MRTQSGEHNDKLALDYLFHPQSIAIAGVSGDLTGFSGGRRFMQSLLEFGFQGKIYPINPSGGEVSGLKIYPSIKDIPDRIDYVISAIPARHTPQLMADCAAKGVKAIHFFASGFSEIEDEEGEQLESEIAQLAGQSGIRIIGPNCMGLYCPKTGLSFALDFPKQKAFPKQSGPLGFLVQSGGNTGYGIREATTRGVYFSKVVSYGNAVDLNETDFLEYFTYDPETEIIAAYIEGVKNGPRFTRVLKEATKVKPVIIFKGGTTESGTKAAASHTSAIAGSNRIWESLLRQAGAIQVHSIEEIVDVVLLFSRISPPKGKNAVVIGGGGGVSVKAADDCSKGGLTLPTLPAQVRQKLKEICATEAGRIFRNPVDIVPFMGVKMLVDAAEVIADCDQVDLLIIHVPFDIWAMAYREDTSVPYIETILELDSMISKPVVAVFHSCVTDEAKKLATEAHVRLLEAGIPVYPSFGRAASAISKFVGYHQWCQGIQGNNDQHR